MCGMVFFFKCIMCRILANVQKLASADLEVTAQVKLIPGHHLHQGGVQLFGFQRDGHGRGFIGLQEACAKLGHLPSFQNCRNGYHVLPVDAGGLRVFSHLKHTCKSQEVGYV